MDWLLLLLADSSLPTGGFVASSGLEAFTSLLPPNSSQASNINLFLTYSTIPYLTQSHSIVCNALTKASEQEESIPTIESMTLAKLISLDTSYATLIKSNNASTRASLAQGIAFLTLLEKPRTAAQCTTNNNSNSNNKKSEILMIPLIQSLKREIRQREDASSGHLVILLGVLCGALGIPLVETQRLFMFHHVRGLVSAAVRLNVVGPYEGQRMVVSLGSVVDSVLRNVTGRMAAVSSSNCARERGEGKIMDENAGPRDAFQVLRKVRRRRDEIHCHDNNQETAVAQEQAIQTGMVVEVVQGLHDRLYSRLFNS
ncbi:hypothetical protein BDR26DRAFT_851568 [Obelidium mucronatum]|nr:hypothetical protein BDR26DRAFT_851568 [Obelidium mucronatum]